MAYAWSWGRAWGQRAARCNRKSLMPPSSNRKCDRAPCFQILGLKLRLLGWCQRGPLSENRGTFGSHLELWRRGWSIVSEISAIFRGFPLGSKTYAVSGCL